MSTVFIVHGASGNPAENWFPWLKEKLEEIGFLVLVPEFPGGENETPEKWQEAFNAYEKYLGPDSIVIGHSLGVPFLLSILEKVSVKAAFFVAGFAVPLDNAFAKVIRSFTFSGFDWGKIKEHCQNFYIFHSDNDPYVPLEIGQKLAADLGMELNLVKDAGHFNTAAGYTEFPLLLEKIITGRS